MRAYLSRDKDWFVVRTNIKSEAKAERNMRQAGYEVYFPFQRVEKWNKRTNTYREIERPLMLRYGFVGQPKVNADWFTLRRCEGVECVLGAEGRPFPVKFEAVEALYLAERDMQFDDTRAARIHRKEEARTKKATTKLRFPVGAEVLITDGVFSDFPGAVERVLSTGHVDVLVELFGRMVRVELEPEQIEHRKRKKVA